MHKIVTVTIDLPERFPLTEQKKVNSKGIIITDKKLEELIKGFIHAHTRKTKTGKTIRVKAHTTGRTAKEHVSSDRIRAPWRKDQTYNQVKEKLQNERETLKAKLEEVRKHKKEVETAKSKGHTHTESGIKVDHSHHIDRHEKNTHAKLEDVNHKIMLHQSHLSLMEEKKESKRKPKEKEKVPGKAVVVSRNKEEREYNPIRSIKVIKQKPLPFDEWYELADIPEKVNGEWVDLETGIPWKPEDIEIKEMTEGEKLRKKGKTSKPIPIGEKSTKDIESYLKISGIPAIGTVFENDSAIYTVIKRKNKNKYGVSLINMEMMDKTSKVVREISVRHYGEPVKEKEKKVKKKALSGSAKQKKWANYIRDKVINSGKLNKEQINDLLQVGGFVDSSKFWIENREVNPSEFTAENIVREWNGLKKLDRKHVDFLVRTNPTYEKEKRRDEIREYLKRTPFNFKSEFI